MNVTLAINRYDRHVPFFMGTLPQPTGLTLAPLEVGESIPFRDGGERHLRMLNHLEFDIAEMSLASFIMSVEARSDVTAGRHPDFSAPLLYRRTGLCGQ